MSDPSSENLHLVERLQRNRQETLAEEFSRYQERLRKMIEFRLDDRLRGRVAASDVLQEAYIEALKRLPHFEAEPDVPFFVWLRTVTEQRLIEVHRHHLGAKARNAAREVRPGGDHSLEASSDRMAEVMAELTSPSQVAQRAEHHEQLRGAIDQLDPTDREVLALRHFEELTNLEVAATLGIQPAAASKRYVRALERLKDALDRLPGFAKETT